MELKAKLHGACDVCSHQKLYAGQVNYFHRDPKLLDFLAKQREYVKNARRKALEAEQRITMPRFKIKEPTSPLKQEQLRIKNRDKIVHKLMTQYRAYLVELEESQKPDYINLVRKAFRLHLERNEFPKYHRMLHEEENAKFDMWAEKITLEDFKKEVGRYWKGDYDTFIEFVMTVKDDLDAHIEFMEASRRQEFANTDPFAELRAVKDRQKYSVGDEYLNRLLSERNRQQFLDKHQKYAFRPKYADPQADINIELAKGFRYNAGTPNPGLCVINERTDIDKGRLIVLDQRISEGHITGLVEAMESTKEIPH